MLQGRKTREIVFSNEGYFKDTGEYDLALGHEELNKKYELFKL